MFLLSGQGTVRWIVLALPLILLVILLGMAVMLAIVLPNDWRENATQGSRLLAGLIEKLAGTGDRDWKP